ALDGIHAVIEGRTDYTIHDPRIPQIDDHEIPRTLDWRAHLAAWTDRAAVPEARRGRFAAR
ncbi:hypothetical protein, partial [Paludisphaera soli]|uniref:hypothetical protein n=1 Tax=Paludisphaera soli TaxID=2712865 RepID=UPI0013EC66F0